MAPLWMLDIYPHDRSRSHSPSEMPIAESQEHLGPATLMVSVAESPLLCEQDPEFQRRTSGPGVCSNIERSLPRSDHTNAVSHPDPTLGDQISQPTQSTRHTCPVRMTSSLPTPLQPVHYGQLRTPLLAKVSGLCHELNSIRKVYTNRGGNFDTYYCENPRSLDWRTILADDDTRDSFSQEFEFRSVEQILACASQLEDTGAAEPAWKEEVHSAVLKLALSQQAWPHLASSRVGYSNMTTAQIAAAFRPNPELLSFQANQIDYCFHVEPSAVAQPAIKSLLNSLPPNMATVNQTLYGPLVERPVFVYVATKTGQLFEDKRKAQLGMWMHAGDRRARKLQNFTKPSSEKAEQTDWQYISVPLLLISGHHWDLYTAVDLGEKIEALKYRQHLGTTRSIGDIYMLLATLRCIAVWGVDMFCPWWEQHVLNLNINLQSMEFATDRIAK